MIEMNDKIKREHLSRPAYVYIRQSTISQLTSNHESRRRQYELAERAKKLGWQEIEIVDEDLGKSGASSINRNGFQRLIAEICLGNVGAIFCIEASRLARNNRDWYHILDICRLLNTLIIDEENTYDTSLLDDRLLLGLKGTMSEMELGLLKQRSLEALKQMAQRGELFTTVPIGYLITQDKRCEKDPDLRIQKAIESVFEKFQEYGSVRQTLLWFRQEEICLPTVNYGSFGREVKWKIPVYNSILKFLQNPIYAGAYAYGRTYTKTKVIDGHAIKSKANKVPMSDWKVLIKNHHPGYINWEEYETNQKKIEDNCNMKGDMVKGSVRRGNSLIAGLIRCGHCGRMLHVTYSGRKGNIPRYSCRGAMVNHGTDKCISFGGLKVDSVISDEVLKILSPQAVKETIKYSLEKREESSQITQSIEMEIQQANYEADRAFRQYDKVDPENRIVASELEKRWNEALLNIRQLERKLEEVKSMECKEPLITEKSLLPLVNSFPDIWKNPDTGMVLKKRIIRCLLEEIVAYVNKETSELKFILHWKGGQHSQLITKRNRTGCHRNLTDKNIVDLVKELSIVCPDEKIAIILNKLGYKTGKGNGWNKPRVCSLRSYHQIPIFDPAIKEREGFMNMKEASDHLAISPMSVRRLLKKGILQGKQFIDYAPWIIKIEHLESDMVKNAIASIKAGRKVPIPESEEQQKLDFIEE